MTVFVGGLFLTCKLVNYYFLVYEYAAGAYYSDNLQVTEQTQDRYCHSISNTDQRCGRSFQFVDYVTLTSPPDSAYLDLGVTPSLESWAFATAASVDYFPVVLDAIATVQTYFPNVTIILYDIDVRPGGMNKHLRKQASVYYPFNLFKDPYTGRYAFPTFACLYVGILDRNTPRTVK